MSDYICHECKVGMDHYGLCPRCEYKKTRPRRWRDTLLAQLDRELDSLSIETPSEIEGWKAIGVKLLRDKDKDNRSKGRAILSLLRALQDAK